jgi:hypothetical protein
MRTPPAAGCQKDTARAEPRSSKADHRIQYRCNLDDPIPPRRRLLGAVPQVTLTDLAAVLVAVLGEP